MSPGGPVAHVVPDSTAEAQPTSSLAGGRIVAAFRPSPLHCCLVSFTFPGKERFLFGGPPCIWMWVTRIPPSPAT